MGLVVRKFVFYTKSREFKSLQFLPLFYNKFRHMRGNLVILYIYQIP